MNDAIIRHDEDLRIVKGNLYSLLGKISGLGISIGNNNRFHQFIRLLDRYYTEVLLGGGKFSLDTLHELLEGYKDYQQLSIIARSDRVMTTGRTSLSKIFAGNLLPSSDTNSQARDFQFELYMAALFDLKGFSVSLEEPDFIFTFKDKKYGVAAKRVTSSEKIEGNLKKGDYQIVKAFSNGLVKDGIIAISLDRLYLQRDSFQEIKDPDSSIRICNEIILNTLGSGLFKPAFFGSRSDRVLAIIASVSIPFILPSKELGYASYQMFLPIEGPDSSRWNEAIYITDYFGRNNMFN